MASLKMSQKYQTNQTESHPLLQSDKSIRVYVRLVFLRIGEIDTLNEKYQAHASIESRWTTPFDDLFSLLSTDDQQRLNQGKSIILTKYAESNWHPQLYIENGLGELKEQIKYSAKLSRRENQIYVCEQRDVKGQFWEKLELHHFPSDVQDLSISITSMFHDDKVLLIPDPHRLSGINREAFVDQQEWSLYEHIDTVQRSLKDFAFRTDTDDDEDAPSNREERKRAVVTITCHAARQSNYFFWNGYFLIWMITSVSFCAFGIPMQNSINRLQVSCTLLLTSVTFRWTVNRSLPTVSYLTSLDRYAIICMLNLVSHSMWHGIISIITWSRTTDYRAAGDSWIAQLDHGAFFVLIGSFFLLHVILVSWLFFVPLKHRKEMKEKDKQYRVLMLEKAKAQSPKGQNYAKVMTDV